MPQVNLPVSTRTCIFPAPSRAILLALLLPLACSPDGDGSVLSRRVDALEAGSSPGLHTMMVGLQYRHATVWFAGEAGNWPLADYHMHEIEELTAEITEAHPSYDDVPVADLMRSLLAPAVEQLAAAVDAQDGAAFEAAYDRLTAQCNACHEASGRAMIVIQRPRTPPLDNVRFSPAQAPAP
jgi:cytochrome c553